MSMECFERVDALHAHEKALRSIKVTDGDSLCAYLKGFWEFIYNYKMFGCVYDIYDDGIELGGNTVLSSRVSLPWSGMLCNCVQFFPTYEWKWRISSPSQMVTVAIRCGCDTTSPAPIRNPASMARRPG